MIRLNLNLSPFQNYYRTNPSTFTLNHIFYTAELQHVDSISIYVGPEFITDDQLRLICQSHSRYLILYADVASNIDELLKLKPNMIMLCQGIDERSFEPRSIKNVLTESELDIFNTIAGHDIRSGIVLPSDLKLIKSLSQSRVDYLHFDLSAINSATDIDIETELLEELKMATIAANKLGFGIMAGGGLTLDNIHLYQDITSIEEFITGQGLFDTSIIDGLVQSIINYRKLVKRI